MKWIGQHIWDFISRFRSDVYLEATETGTIASGGNLGLDSNNKVVKATSGSGDLTLTNETDNRVVTSTGGTGLNAEAGLTFDGTTLNTSAVLVQQTNASAAVLGISNSGDNATGGGIVLNNSGGGVDMSDNDSLGVIQFTGLDDGTPSSQTYAIIEATIADVTSGQEAGKLEFQVAEYDGTNTTGLKLDGDTDADGEIDVTIGAGAASVTTIAGDLDVDGDNMTSAGAMTFTPVGLYTIVAPDISGPAFVIDADADTDNEVEINAGLLDVNTTASISIDTATDISITATNDAMFRGADDVSVATTSADGLLTLSSSHTAGQAIHINGSTDAGSIVDIDAGILDIDVTGVTTIDTTELTITGKAIIPTRKFTITSSTHHEAQGDIVYFGTAHGSKYAQGDICYLDTDAVWTSAQADAENTSSQLLGVALGADPAINGMLLRGMITLDHNTADSNDGRAIYLSEDTAGQVTAILPASAGDVVRIVGYKMGDDDEVWFCPDNTYVTRA